MHNAESDESDVTELSQILGVSIDPDLLALALTHRSYAYEHGGIPHNERLEFLGDSVLGLAVTVMLYRENPDLAEGDLAKRRASLVSSVALAEIGHQISLGSYVRLGRGEILTGGQNKTSILADTVEAIIGAVYIDAGGEAATALVLRLIAPLLRDPERFGAAMDPKTNLQEVAVARGAALPLYTIEASGPDHRRLFSATVKVGDVVTARGEGTSKKQAEMAAALKAWETLNVSANPEN